MYSRLGSFEGLKVNGRDGTKITVVEACIGFRAKGQCGDWKGLAIGSFERLLPNLVSAEQDCLQSVG